MDHHIARLDQQEAWFAPGAALEPDTTLTTHEGNESSRSSMRPTRPRGTKDWPARCGLGLTVDLELTYTVPATAA